MKIILSRKYILLIIISSAFLLAFAPMLGRQGRASSPTVHAMPQSQPAPDVYLVNVTLLNISDINISAGTYTADLFISFVCKNAPCHYEPHWDVMNAAQDIAPVDQGTSVPFYSYNYRLKTTLIGNVDYTFYPFSYICYHIFIEDKQLGNDKITYRLNSLQEDKTLFNPSGWHYRPEQGGSTVTPVSYYNNPTKFDRLDFWIFMERDRLGAFMKTIFAALVIILVGLLSYLLRVDDAKERLALVSSTLVALVLYHISLVASVPDTGYLTFIDKFMVANYVVIFISLAVSVLLLVYINTKQKDRAEKLHIRTRWAIPVFWLVLMVYVFVFQLVIPYSQLLASLRGM